MPRVAYGSCRINLLHFMAWWHEIRLNWTLTSQAEIVLCVILAWHCIYCARMIVTVALPHPQSHIPPSRTTGEETGLIQHP